MDGAVIVAVLLLALVAVLQVALALGAPLGKAAWGGQHDGVLPTRLRVASGVAGVVVYPLIIVAVLAAAGRWSPGTGREVAWALAGLFVVGGLANAA